MEITPNKIPSIVCQIIIGKVCRKQIAKNKVNVNFEFLNKIFCNKWQIAMTSKTTKILEKRTRYLEEIGIK